MRNATRCLHILLVATLIGVLSNAAAGQMQGAPPPEKTAVVCDMRNNDAYTNQRTLAGFAQPPFEDQKLKSIHAPTLVLWGRQDELIGVDRGEKFRDGIPGAKLVVFEQCGHVPQLEKPAEFNKVLLDFLGT